MKFLATNYDDETITLPLILASETEYVLKPDPGEAKCVENMLQWILWGKRKRQHPENETDGESEGRLEVSEGINDTGTTATGTGPSRMDGGEEDDRG